MEETFVNSGIDEMFISVVAFTYSASGLSIETKLDAELLERAAAVATTEPERRSEVTVGGGVVPAGRSVQPSGADNDRLSQFALTVLIRLTESSE